MFDCAIHSPKTHVQFPVAGGTLSLDGEMLEFLDRSVAWPSVGPYRWSLQSHGAGRPLSMELTNQATMIRDGTGRRIHSGESVTLTLPRQLWMGSAVVELIPTALPQWLGDALVRLPSNLDMKESAQWDPQLIGDPPSSVTLAHWFDALGRLHRCGAQDPDFFDKAAASLISPGGLDGGLILIRDGAEWQVAGSRLPNPEHGISWYRGVLDQAIRQRHTVYHNRCVSQSEQDFEYARCVCAPVLDAHGAVIAAVYGMRTSHRMNQRHSVRPLEAQFVQQVAECVSATLIRREREAELSRRQVLLEQAFPPAIVGQLTYDDRFLEGHQREVSVLFCDLRGFSKICDRLAGPQIYRLLSQIMDLLTDRIREHQGVVIDYFGDGLAAFWNAPVEQTNHPELACRAALEMLEDIDTINEEWSEVIGFPISLGIGIHRGQALIGNSGSRYRIKYGPRGQTVNTACRIESATKSIGVPLLISHSIRERLGKEFLIRRIGRIRMRGIEQPVDLAQPHLHAISRDRQAEFDCYEQALSAFQHERFDECLEAIRKFPRDSIIEQPLFDFLAGQANARRDGRFNRRHDDADFEFMTNPTGATTRAKKSRSSVHH